MCNSCAVCSLAVAICLVVCLSANASVSQDEATKEVAAAKQSVKTVYKRAQDQHKNATSVLEKVEASNSKAAQASSQAKEAATGNPKAEEIANTIKSFLDAVETAYSDAKRKIETVISGLTPLLEEAKKLDERPDIKITANTASTQDFTDTKNAATAFKGEAVNLDGRITNALDPMDELYSKANEMEQKAKKAQLGYFQVGAIVAVTKIESMMKDDDNIIAETQNKMNEVNRIVEEMENLKATAPRGLTKLIDELCNSANEALHNATEAVKKAMKAKGDKNEQKQNAADALKNVQEAQEVTEALGEERKAKACVEQVTAIVPQLENALQTAKDSLTNAAISKQKLVEALEKSTSQQNTQQSKDKEETNPPVVDGTDSQNKDATIQGTSTDSPDQSNNSAEEIKYTLVKGAQNVPTTALTGEKAPAPGAKNDSAMTVSVPLLVALIASAVFK